MQEYISIKKMLEDVVNKTTDIKDQIENMPFFQQTPEREVARSLIDGYKFFLNEAIQELLCRTKLTNKWLKNEEYSELVCLSYMIDDDEPRFADLFCESDFTSESRKIIFRAIDEVKIQQVDDENIKLDVATVFDFIFKGDTELELTDHYLKTIDWELNFKHKEDPYLHARIVRRQSLDKIKEELTRLMMMFELVGYADIADLMADIGAYIVIDG